MTTTTPFTYYDILDNQTPQQAMSLLWVNLQSQKRFLHVAEAAYNGDSRNKGWSTTEFARHFKHLNHFTDNFLKMVVDAYVSRLIIQGFQIGESNALSSPGDEAAWGIWKANRLDQAVTLAHREAMKFGVAYLMVDPFTTVGKNNVPRITVESPFHMSVYQDPSDRYTNAAALKHWQGADGFLYANLFTANKCLKFRSSKSYMDWTEAGMYNQQPIPETINWDQTDEFSHDLGCCPVVSIENQPTLTRGGMSDLEELLPLQRAIDNLCRNMLIAAEYAAFPQKYILGIDQPKDADGNPQWRQAMEASMSRLWATPPVSKDNHPPQVGTFEATDLANYTGAMEEIIHNMAMVCSVPAYRLMGKLANLSASAILAAEAGFIDACRTKQTDYGAGWAKAIALAMSANGKDTAVEDVTILWKEPSAVSGANLAASLIPLQAVGVPEPVLWSMMGASPEEIDRWTGYNAAQAVAEPAPGAAAPVAAGLMAHNGANGNASPDGMDDSATAALNNLGVPTGNGSPAQDNAAYHQGIADQLAKKLMLTQEQYLAANPHADADDYPLYVSGYKADPKDYKLSLKP